MLYGLVFLEVRHDGAWLNSKARTAFSQCHFGCFSVSSKQLVKLEITADLAKARIQSSLATLSGSRQHYLENN